MSISGSNFESCQVVDDFHIEVAEKITLEIEAAFEAFEPDHHMGAIGFALLQPLVPRLDIRNGRPVDLQLEIAIELCAGRDVAIGERLTGDEGPVGEVPVEDLEENGAPRDAAAYQVPVSLFFR